MRKVRRWAAALSAVAILTAGWTAPAEANGESVPITMWLYAWTWDWITWADEFGWDMIGFGAELASDLTSDEVGASSTSYSGSERFYWTTGYTPPTANAITGMSTLIDHVTLGSTSGSSTIRFNCGHGNTKTNEGRFVFHDSWLHFIPPSNTTGHYIESFAAYHCGPSSSSSYYRYMESQEHAWTRDAEGKLVRSVQRRGPFTMPDYNNHRYVMERHGKLWHLHWPGVTSYYEWENTAPPGRAMNWGVESNFNAGGIYSGHVAIADTRHQYGEGTGFFPHSQNGTNSVQEAPWGGHISVYRNAQNTPYYNGVHVCTYSSTCGG